MRTVAITHRIDPGNVQPLTQDEIAYLVQNSLVAIGSNWRGRSEADWRGHGKATAEFERFSLLARDGGLVIANYEGLGAHQRVIGRVAPTASGQHETDGRLPGLRVLRLRPSRRINGRDEGIADLQVTPGSTIIDVTDRAGDRILRLLSLDGEQSATAPLIDLVARAARDAGAHMRPVALKDLREHYWSQHPAEERGRSPDSFDATLNFHCINMRSRFPQPSNKRVSAAWITRPLFKRTQRGEYMLLDEREVAAFRRRVEAGDELVYRDEYDAAGLLAAPTPSGAPAKPAQDRGYSPAATPPPPQTTHRIPVGEFFVTVGSGATVGSAIGAAFGARAAGVGAAIGTAAALLALWAYKRRVGQAPSKR